MRDSANWPRVGFDFGGAYVKLAQMDKKGISRMVSEPVPDGLFKDGDIASANSAVIYLRELIKKNRVKAKECAFILPAGRALYRQLSTPVMDEKQIRRNLPFEFGELIVGSKDDYYFDYSIAGLRKNSDGEVTGLEIASCAISKESMQDYRRFFHMVGLKLKIAAPRENVFSNIIRTYEANCEEISEGEDYCFVDIGHNATRVHLYSGPVFQGTRVIEYGGAMVDSAIARDLSIDLTAARAYKENSQEATRYLHETSTAYKSIALEIRKALNFYQAEKKVKRGFERIYCCGGGYWLVPLLDSIKEIAGVEVLDVTELLPPTMGSTEQAQNIVGAAAIGITLQ